ncbi:hypothetical protein EGW08_002664, partial [Elysia chlorotica]
MAPKSLAETPGYDLDLHERAPSTNQLPNMEIRVNNPQLPTKDQYDQYTEENFSRRQVHVTHERPGSCLFSGFLAHSGPRRTSVLAPLLLLLLLLLVPCEARRDPSRQRAQRCDASKMGCHQDAECLSMRKAHRCQCKPGFYGDGKVCKDENECAHDNGGCTQVCQNKAGNYSCTCKDGFVLAPDGHNCE